ncbi:D-alanine--D-alanine ligase [Thorsellia anophelis]|uniref:D-alanine--D-alanine ligase n=1 Tax=Thorsellia anophelis DSM 18579 TaxID=1123402 RepID=A0A1H9ZDL7_9GAMM|nr:D-alanine--D-alanine ligase [Thorsellia anophelis]SES78943.1 D-alanine--D-alanine ligase [Thorsellia anophelis DSM 18579]
MFTKIAVLMGGESSEREVSLNSGKAVLDALLENGLNAIAIDPADYSLINLKSDGFTSAFIALHGSDGENGTVQGVLDYLNIPYTGSGVQACAVGLNKHFCKVLWKAAGLPVAEYVALSQSEYRDLTTDKLIESVSKLGLPIFVKPNTEGSSVGVSKVSDYLELKAALDEAFKYDDLALIETYLPGDEFSVPVVLGKVYPSIRIKSMNSFYDYEAKYILDNTNYQCPSLLSQEEEAKIGDIAYKAFNVIGCRGWARIDLMQDAKGEFVLLEINTSPGMTSHSLVPKSANSIGQTFQELVAKIMASAQTS